MKIYFEYDPEEKKTSIGIAKGLIENASLSNDELHEISQHLMVYCQARSLDMIASPLECAAR